MICLQLFKALTLVLIVSCINSRSRPTVINQAAFLTRVEEGRLVNERSPTVNTYKVPNRDRSNRSRTLDLDLDLGFQIQDSRSRPGSRILDLDLDLGFQIQTQIYDSTSSLQTQIQDSTSRPSQARSRILDLVLDLGFQIQDCRSSLDLYLT